MMTVPLLVIITSVLSFLIPSESQLPFPDGFEECTAGVASGRATTDGRPLLWKTRDAGAVNNEVIWNTSGTYPFVSVISAGDERSSWMGVNDQGFAIINTLSMDLKAGSSGLHNGLFMALALQECATVEDFENLLIETNETGRRTNTNLGVIDATGAAAFFETAGNEYWRYDAANTEKGYILRTNFARNGDGSTGDPSRSMDRYLQTEQLMIDFYRTDKIDFKEIVKDQIRTFGTSEGDLVRLPFTGSIDGHPEGYFPNNSSINRNSSVSFAVIQGVLPEEDARLSTMWTILGQPSTGILVPYWPVGGTPSEANGPETAPLADAANEIRKELYEEFEGLETIPPRTRPLYINTNELLDEDGTGIWTITLPVEDSIIAASEMALEEWRTTGVDVEGMLEAERTLAAKALETIKKALAYLKGVG
jgi:hypothetical protein